VFERRANSVRIDLTGIDTSRQLHERLAQAFGFPDYYGQNWDAFDECIRDVALPEVVELHGLFDLRGRLPRDAKLLLKCLQDVTSESQDRASSIRIS
jgi:ribonuclease inhibitor